MRFCATMRRPACSKRWLIAPVRLRLVASGLMIDKVRSMVIRISRSGRAALYIGRKLGRQPAAKPRRLPLLLPAGRRLLPIGQIMPGLASAAPAAARRLDRVRVVSVENIGATGKGLEILGFEPVDDNDHRSAIR